MNNEPVAWYNADDSSLSFKNHGGGWQPLYTHPAKTLTDEEIADIISSGEYWTLDEHLNIVSVHFDKFARAILRKAQEK